MKYGEGVSEEAVEATLNIEFLEKHSRLSLLGGAGSLLETMGPVRYKGCSRIDVNSNVHHPIVHCPIIHRLIQSSGGW